MIPRTTIAELRARYDALFFDAYGTLVDTRSALPGAAELTASLTRDRVPWFVLTNDASRSPENAAERYRRLGLTVANEQVINASALVAPFLRERATPGASCAVLGPEDGVAAARAGGVEVVPFHTTPLEVLVIADETGFPLLEGIDATISALYRTIESGRTPLLVLPNPDLVFTKSAGEFGIAAGSVALVIEAALNARFPGRDDLRFVRLGKPHRPIFDEALRRAGTRRAVLVGDSLDTDIRGARDAGIDSALVVTGVSRLDRAPSVTPTWLLESLLA